MLDVPELAAQHGARGAQRQGGHDPGDRVTGLGNYTRNVGYKTGSITYEFETKTFNYDRGIRLLADVMDVKEAGVLDCFVAAGSELQRTQVVPETGAFTFSEIAGHEGVAPVEEDFSDADAEDVLASLCAKWNTRKLIATPSPPLHPTQTPTPAATPRIQTPRMPAHTSNAAVASAGHRNAL